MSATLNTPRLEQLRKLHEADPSDADVCYMIAQELGKADEHAQAIEWYDICLAADDTYCYAYFFKAIAQRNLDLTDEAIETIRAGLPIAEQSGHPKAFAELSQLLDEISG